MKPKKTILINVRLGFLLVCCLAIYASFVLAQTTSETKPVQVDAYGDLPTDDEAARLDFLALNLSQQPKMRGHIIAYYQAEMDRGTYLRRIYGIAKYLTYNRGIEASRVAVVDGGYKARFSTELWLIPENASPPAPVSTMPQPAVKTSAAYKFDEECLDCALAVGLYLDGLDEGLKFYAEELQEQPGARGLIVVRPDVDVTIRRALAQARKARTFLITKYGIDANRVIVKSARSRKDGTAVVEMWVVPAGIKVPT